MQPYEVLKHLAGVCVRNDDGSLSVGTEEVKLIEEAIKQYKPVYGGWDSEDVLGVAENLGYDLPEVVAEEIISYICSKSCDVCWESIEDYILNHKHYGYDFTEYRNDMYCGDDDE